jgi:FKBP-type peptidyl-prolyl cis-trans isomerase FkpA
MKNIFLFLFISLFIFSCGKNKLSEEEQLAQDIEIIKTYIADNNLNAQETASGLHIVIDNQGSGASPNLSNSVTIRYKGYFTDGNVFDESAAEGATFPLSNLIEGWQEGIPYFNEGGKGMLLIPSSLGYGPDGNSAVPANSVLIFDIELFEVIN